MNIIIKLLTKPFGIAFGVLAGLVAKRVFQIAWARVDDQPPPSPTTAETTWPKVLAASALQAATFSVARAAADRASALTVRHLFGFWPGEERAED